MEAENEVASVMSELQWGSGSKLYSALIMIRTTLIKSRSALNQLVQLGAVQFLIQLLEDRHRHVNQTKTTDIVMSILANLCLEEDAREKVVCCEGLPVIARVTLSSEQESIQNRGVRALANLAQDVSNCDKIFDLEVPAFVTKKLMETEDVECQSTYCRALQLFGQTGKDVKRLMEDTQAIQALAALLKLDNRKLALKSLRILSELSALRCCPSFTGQILAANVLEELVTFADDEDNSPASYSLSVILRLCEQEIMRPALGSAGAISLLVKLMKSDRSGVNKVWILNALCLCTKEAVNRNKVQEAGGLELFMAVLNESQTGHFSQGKFSVLYDRIISSLVNFLYNDDCFEKLLELGLVRILMYHLKRSCNFTSLNDNFREEVDSLAVILETYETTCAGRDKLLIGNSNIETECLISNDMREGLSLSRTSASCPISEYCNVALQHNSKKESVKTENVIFLSQSSDQSLGDQTSEEHQRVSKDKLNGSDEYVDPLLIDNIVMDTNNGMMTDYETEKSPSRDSEEPIFHQTNKSQHTFSINSPTYQSETSWRLEDYTSGVTCKSFSQEQDSYRLSSHVSPNSVNTGILQTPYSPLSGGASYYSQSQSSPSHSAETSPQHSLLSNSPPSVLYQDSFAWLFPTPNYQRSPGRYLSPVRLASPLSIPDYSPASPTYSDQNSPSSTPSSQASLFSQDTFVTFSERHLDSLGNAAGAFEHLDQLLATSGEATTSGVPGAEDPLAVKNIYSASEEEDDDDHSDVGNESQPPLKISNIGRELYPKKADNCSTAEKVQDPEQLLTNKRFKAMDTATSSKGSVAGMQDKVTDTCNLEHGRMNHKFMSLEADRGICHTENKSKVGCNFNAGFNPDAYSSDDEEIIKLSPGSIVTNSSTDISLKTNEPAVRNTLSSLKTNTFYADKGTQRPLSAGFGKDTENIALKSFQRVSSYPGKEKLPAKTSSFKRNNTFAVSPTSQHGASPKTVSKYQQSPLISDSPYRSPYPEPSHNSVTSVTSNESLNIYAETTKDGTRSNSMKQFANKSSFLPGKSQTIYKKTDFATKSTIDSDSSAKIVFTPDNRVDQNTNDVRVKKILRTTETNILILLARVSVKMKPIHLTETTVISYLLGYIASSSNPISRSCRILHRICSNPHCFEKLILTQVPVMLVKSLVFENDGTFPHVLFGTNGNNGRFSDLILSSQGSDSGSQTSEFGRRIDFEFGGDAYSRMKTEKHSSLKNMFKRNRSFLPPSETFAMFSTNTGDDIYEAGSSRVETRIRIGIELLHTIGAVAMSRFGEGEIKHLLLKHSAQDRLACVISMLHLRVGWCRTTRHEFFTKYSIYEKILPCLFVHEAPLVREAIVAAISLNVHIDNPPKLTQKVITLPTCPDLEQAIEKPMPACSAKSNGKQSNNTIKLKPKLFPKNSDKFEISSVGCKSHDTDRQGFNHISNLQGNESTTLNCEHGYKIDQMDCYSDTATLCQHQNMFPDHDVCFSIQGENDVIHKVRAHRKTLIRKSEVFGAMFSCSFKESTQSEISIPDVDRYAFEFLIHYLHGCSSGCSVIDSLSMESLKGEIIVTEVSSTESQECDVVKVSHDQEKDLDKNSIDDFRRYSHELNKASKGSGKSFNSSLELDTMVEASGSNSSLTHSQDSLDSLTLEDRPESEKTSHSSRKVDFNKNDSGDTVASQMDLDSKELSEASKACFNELINRCENIVALADRFLLHGLVQYPTSILAHVCLCPHTIENIFHLACHYKLDSLAFDCIRETLMSHLPCNEAATIYVELAMNGYKEQVLTALRWLLSYLHSD